MKIKKENKMKVGVNFTLYNLEDENSDAFAEEVEIDLDLTGDKADYDYLINKIQGLVEEYKNNLENKLNVEGEEENNNTLIQGEEKTFILKKR
jgi:hypothetical protein